MVFTQHVCFPILAFCHSRWPHIQHCWWQCATRGSHYCEDAKASPASWEVHHEIWKYYQSTSTACAEVLQNLMVSCCRSAEQPARHPRKLLQPATMQACWQHQQINFIHHMHRIGTHVHIRKSTELLVPPRRLLVLPAGPCSRTMRSCRVVWLCSSPWQAAHEV